MRHVLLFLLVANVACAVGNLAFFFVNYDPIDLAIGLVNVFAVACLWGSISSRALA